jgi:hypothetical protein
VGLIAIAAAIYFSSTPQLPSASSYTGYEPVLREWFALSRHDVAKVKHLAGPFYAVRYRSTKRKGKQYCLMIDISTEYKAGNGPDRFWTTSGFFSDSASEQLRFLRMAPQDRLVLLVGFLRYADLDGEARPSTSVGNVFSETYKRVEGIAAWSHDAGVPQGAVRSAIAAAIRAGLLEQRKQVRLPPHDPCGGGAGCETVYRFVPEKPFVP